MLSYEFLKDVWNKHPDPVRLNMLAVVDLHNPETAHLFCKTCHMHYFDCCTPRAENYYGCCNDVMTCAWKAEWET